MSTTFTPSGQIGAVSERAIIQRINRKLPRCDGLEDLVLRTYRGSRTYDYCDRYHYLLNWRLGIVTYSFFNLEQLEELARDLGVLADWETIEGE